jgi:hypothetical protein
MAFDLLSCLCVFYYPPEQRPISHALYVIFGAPETAFAAKSGWPMPWYGPGLNNG